jgi:YebC/PmpR family DNA-binding regulatory protein
MSGHSKWATIKHKKAATDAKKGKAYSIVSRLIRISVKEGKSGDPDQNPRLRLAIEKARSVNMPKENIQRAIDRGLGKSKSGQAFEEITYEGYGPAGVAFMVFVVTDNRNRTSGEIRSTFEKNGGSLGGPGSSAFMFERNADGEYIPTMPAMGLSEQDLAAANRLVEALEVFDDVELVVTNIPA